MTSDRCSPPLEGDIGHARLPIEHADLGRRFDVDTPHGRERDVIALKPFIDPEKAIPTDVRGQEGWSGALGGEGR